MCTGVFTDSRSPMAGGLFVALCGEKFDGHDFVSAVAGSGAAGAVIAGTQLERVQRTLTEANCGYFFLVTVDDTLAALHGLARGHRLTSNAPVIAITGSNGKTTTKEMTAACLSTQVQVLATHKNYNNEIGVPLTLLGLKPEHGACVVEIAMRGIGQITQLSAVAVPDVAVVTNVGPVHLATLGSVENVARAKSELVQGLSSHGVAVLNADDPRVAAMQTLAPGRVVTYGMVEQSVVQAQNVKRDADGSDFMLVLDGHEVGKVRVSLPGSHNVHNALAALAATYAAGFDVAQAVPALAKLPPPLMRLETSRLPGGITLVNDAYNASPLSMRAGLEVLSSLPGSRKVAVLGDMLELGTEHERQHLQVGRLAVEFGVELLVAVGEGGQLIADGAREAAKGKIACIWQPSAAHAAASIRSWIRPGDCILIKASRGMHLEQVAEAVVAAASAGAER